MRAVFDVVLVGRTPLGSAVRGVLVTILLTLFWTLFFTRRWPLFSDSLITALAVLAAAHLISTRDDSTVDARAREPGVDPDPPVP